MSDTPEKGHYLTRMLKCMHCEQVWLASFIAGTEKTLQCPACGEQRSRLFRPEGGKVRQ